MKLSLHTAQASLRPDSSEPTRYSMECETSLARIVCLSGSLAILTCGRSRWAPFGPQLRDAPSDGRRSSFALPDSRRFHMLSCHSTPGRRGHIRSITDRPWLLRPSQGCVFYPALRLGRPRPAWPKNAAFPCSAFDTGGFRSALLHRQSDEFAPGHVRQPGLDCVPFWLQP